MGWPVVATKLEFDVLANDRASSKLDKIGNTLLDVGRSATMMGNDAGKGMGKLTQGAGSALKGLAKLPALAAGTAIGAALVAGIGSAMDVQDARAKLTAGLGLTKPMSAKIGKVAGDLYKDAYGESVGEVGDVLEKVFQSGLAKTGDAEDAIKGVTAQVLNYSKISNEEALPVTRAVAQMLKTGLAKNATEAFDVLTRGQQLGINKSEDLLDTFNEYGTQFRKIGLDGPTALGLMNQALQAGARDSDTAADALKEFAIRAVDGSKASSDGFKSLGLNAKDMQQQIATGGPKAAAGLDAVLDRLRNVKDPAERARIAVALFGTKAEDLGDALFAMDTSTAVAGLGKLKGAAEDAGEALNDTARTKLTAVVRTLKMGLVDALGKHALPKLEEFADWFNGPGKMVMVSWALEGASAMVDFADKTLGALESMVGGLSKYARISLIAAAGSVAVFAPGMALRMLEQADALGEWAEEAKTGIGDAREELQGWKIGLDKTNLTVKLKANIADLESKLRKATKELKDPNLTKERRAQLTATKRDLDNKLNAAFASLGNPALTKARVAHLEADKRDLDNKINAAHRSLAQPGLTATKKAKLEADIAQLLKAKKQAQDAIDALKGKTVNVNVWTNYFSKGTPFVPGQVPGRAHGGPVSAGRAYIVGEQRPEVFVPDVNGQIIPSISQATGGGMGGRGGDLGTVRFELVLDGKTIQTKLLKLKKFNGGLALGLA